MTSEVMDSQGSHITLFVEDLMLVSALFVVVAVIHLMPVVGVAGADKLTHLYGVSFSSPDAVVLMQHRAVMFGLLGGLFLYAAFDPAVQALAWCVAMGSVVSFLVLAAGHASGPLRKVVIADVVALICLVVIAGIELAG